jgi:hypothetical protein
MKNYILFASLFFLLARCEKELAFENQFFEKKIILACNDNCPFISIRIPIAKDAPVVADSINKKVFSVLKEIVYFGEKPNPSNDYKKLVNSFIDSYDKLHKDFPKDALSWEAKIDGAVQYMSENIINIQIKHYTYTGGAHGYQGERSLLFDPKTGKIILQHQLFKDQNSFRAFAEKKFRNKYKIPENESINATGFLFKNDSFHLPENIFYTDQGLLLYYNPYEAASFVEGSKELILPYRQIKDYLLLK